MPENKEIFNSAAGSKIAKRLLRAHFDGILMIDVKSGLLMQEDEELAGKLIKLVRFDDTPYEEQADNIIKKWISHADRETLINSVKLANVRSELEKHSKYDVDFHTKADINNNWAYKRLSYEYLDNSEKVIVMVLEDVSDILSNETDPLTGLYNSTGFHNHVKEWIEKNPDKKYMILRYDIDRFKDINGVYGYEMGNKFLRDCGRCMKEFDAKNTFAAHLNADHFVRFCADDNITAEKCYEHFKKCFAGYNLKIPITTHVGVYDLCEEDCDSYTMSYKALLALQSEKGNLRKHIAYYEKGMMDFEIEHQELLNDIPTAIKREEFEVWFQPKIDYNKKRLIGAEALVRWRHPEKGLISPEKFIPMLERSDYIAAVDMFVIEKTCRYMRKWMDKISDIPITVSVNLSRNDIYDESLCGILEQLTEKYNIPKNSLKLEITESVYMDNPEVFIESVDRLKQSGFVIEMDDFGSGYSSLNTLKDIDIDVLKLDMKFLSDSNRIEKSKTIISSVINMAEALGLPVIAEGVETKQQAETLLSYGCKYMQGYYFSKPVPAEDYEKMLRMFDKLDVIHK